MNAEIIPLLERYQTPNEEDKVLKQQFLQFIAAFPDNFHLRSNLTGHLTGSAWVLDSESKSKVLLVKHTKLQRWLQPGGHADGDGDLQRVAMKELLEETGIVAENAADGIFDLDVHAIPWHKQVPPHLHFDVRFLFFASITAPLQISSESQELAWVSLDKLQDYNPDQSVLRLKEKSFVFLR